MSTIQKAATKDANDGVEKSSSCSLASAFASATEICGDFPICVSKMVGVSSARHDDVLKFLN